MNFTRGNISIFSTLLSILLITGFISSCSYDKEFAYINDQINNLNKKTSSIDDQLISMNERLGTVNANQAQMTVEMDRLKEDLNRLSGRIEDNEYILKNTVEKDLGEQETIQADVTRLSRTVEKLERVLKQQQTYLGLESPVIEGAQQGVIETEPEREESAEVDQGSEEGKMYDAALSLYREEDYEQASEEFKKFLSLYPKSDLADNSQFWIGECLMALKQYEQAILAYQEVITKYPNGNKVANAMLRQAIAFLEINDKTSARLLLQKVIKQFPGESEAQIAQKKLKAIK